jgi:hypothetical protein
MLPTLARNDGNSGFETDSYESGNLVSEMNAKSTIGKL